MDGWYTLMADMWGSMQDHHDTMHDCASVSDCHAAEAEWQQHMTGLFDQMDQMDPAWDEDCDWGL